MRKKKCIVEGCGGKAKLMKISAWDKKPIEYNFQCEKNPDHKFIFTGYEQMWETPQGKPHAHGGSLRTPFVFPKKFTGSTQWVEN